ncbi:MAG: lipoate--protein ligase family protein [Nitrospirota bacterium]
MDPWRLILDPPSPASYNMAVDEALVDSCRRGASGPTLRLYGWDRPAISLGYFQRPDQVVDLDLCRDAGVPVVRRTTGGRAVYHRHEVTYSVVAPVPHPCFPPTIRGTYETIGVALEAALVRLGFRVARRDRDAERVRQASGSPLCFAATSRNELTLDGKKVVGSAQRRWPTAFLQHGSILLRYDPREVSQFFPAEPDALESITGLGAHRESVTPVEVCQTLVASWERLFGVALRPAALTADEAAAVAETSHARDLTVTQPV